MKRAKIMLMAIAVLATVGGALAFKATKIGQTNYCYIITNEKPGIGDCTSVAVLSTIQSRDDGFYTTTDDITRCTQALCESIGVPDAQ